MLKQERNPRPGAPMTLFAVEETESGTLQVAPYRAFSRKRGRFRLLDLGAGYGWRNDIRLDEASFTPLQAVQRHIARLQGLEPAPFVAEKLAAAQRLLARYERAL